MPTHHPALWTSLRRNPLRRRLVRSSGCLASNAALLLVLLIAGWCWVAILRAMGGGASAWTFLAVVVALSLVLAVSLFTASVAVNLPASYLRSREHELVWATSISDESLLWGLLMAVLYHARVPIAAAVLLSPLVAVFQPVPWPTAMGMGWSGPIYSVPQTVYFLGLFALALLGRTVLVAALGTGLLLWWRATVPALVAALLAGEALWWLAALALMPWPRFATAPVVTPERYAWALVLALVPFGLTVLVVRAAGRWVRGGRGGAPREV